VRILLFYHSLVSDWNHGNAHFLRGIASELLARGHHLTVFEPHDAWSRRQLEVERGPSALVAFDRRFPHLRAVRYALGDASVARALDEADLVLVHEWNEPALVAAIGAHRAACGGYLLLFHDTHHRAVTDARAMSTYDLRHYDGVLAFGEVLQRVYLSRGWARRAFVWHEAADTRVFFPRAGLGRKQDVVFIGNWGDGERTAELQEFVIGPATRLTLRTRIHGVRYPDSARQALSRAGIEYGGWVANYEVPDVFARFRVTLHVPRRPYVEALPGIPTIRPFEALACGIPLVSSPWSDVEGLFRPGRDFLVVETGAEMERAVSRLLADDAFADDLAAHGLATVRARHTCRHRVDELLEIHDALRPETFPTRVAIA